MRSTTDVSNTPLATPVSRRVEVAVCVLTPDGHCNRVPRGRPSIWMVEVIPGNTGVGAFP